MTTQILAGAMTLPRTHNTCAPATHSSIDGQTLIDTQRGNAVDGTQLPASHTDRDAQQNLAGGDPFAEAIRPTNTHKSAASATQLGDSHKAGDTHSSSTVADPTSAGSQASVGTHPCIAPGGFLRDPVLGVLADVVDDLETVRMANANRVRQLTRTGTDKDGEERGFGLTEDHPEVAKLILTVKALGAAEHDAILNLQRALRKHPLAPFQKRHKGIGEKQLARLLAVIGDPFWNDLHQRPRTVSELWAYAGFHVIKTSGGHFRRDTHHVTATGTQRHTGSQVFVDAQTDRAPGVAPKRQRGQRSNWSEDARKRVWVIADKTVMNLRKPCIRPEDSDYAIHADDCECGKYRLIYDTAREKYAGSIHATDCVRCGPKGKPAPAGSPRSDGHTKAMAVRIVAKDILKDLWIDSRDLYAGESQSPSSPVTPPGFEAASPAVSSPDTAGGASKTVPS